MINNKKVVTNTIIKFSNGVRFVLLKLLCLKKKKRTLPKYFKFMFELCLRQGLIIINNKKKGS